MPTPILITDLSVIAANCSPSGSDSPGTLDDIQRAHGSFIAQLAAGTGFASTTGTGALVKAVSPTLTTPALGTPTALVLTNATGAPASITLTNATGLPPAGVVGTAAILGANIYTGRQSWATGAAIASAATVNLDAALDGNRHHITGTTAITAVTLTRGPRTVIFDDVLTLTHNATTNNLPGAANIITAANDRAVYESDGTTVYCTSYTRANGTAVLGTGALNLLATVTPTAAANVDFLNLFSAAYDNYQIEIDGVGPNVLDKIMMRFAVAGVADAGALYTDVIDGTNSSATKTSFDLAINTAPTGNSLLSVKVKNTNGSSFKSIHTNSQTQTLTNYFQYSGGAVYAGTSAVTGFRLFWSAGNSFRAIGKVRIYGYQN